MPDESMTALEASIQIFEEYYTPDMKENEYNPLAHQDVVGDGPFPPEYQLCSKESLLLVKERWNALTTSFYNEKTGEFDTSKIPDLYDAIKYDALHNSNFLKNIRPLYRGIHRIADFVIPQEYGITRNQKLFIGKRVCQPLLNNIVANLENGLQQNPKSRVFLYFSSESHLHCLRNVLLLSGIPYSKNIATTLESIELNYMAHCVLRLFEDVTRKPDDPKRFYVNVQFSPGAALDPFVYTFRNHILPVSRPVPVHGRVPWTHFRHLFLREDFCVEKLGLGHYKSTS